jgi:hypothetical protein
MYLFPVAAFVRLVTMLLEIKKVAQDVMGIYRRHLERV